MGESIRIIPLSDQDAWSEAVAAFGRPSHAWAYQRAISRVGAEAQLALVESGSSRMILPFVEREWHGSVDIATPIGLSGASIEGPGSAPLELWRDYARGRGWVAGYIQLADDVASDIVANGDPVIEGNEVFLLDIGGSDPVARASEIVRRKLRRANRAGATLVLERSELASSLVRLYPSSMERLGASDGYLHDQAGLRTLASAPDVLVVGAALAGAIESVSVFLHSGHRAEYACNGCTERGRELAAWLIVEAIVRLREMGVTELNLGGGIAPGDGLHQFKARFNGRPRPIRSIRQVYDRDRYLQLCADQAVDPQGDWFPAYRASASGD